MEASKVGWEGGRSGQAAGGTGHKDGWQGEGWGEGQAEERSASSWVGSRGMEAAEARSGRGGFGLLVQTLGFLGLSRRDSDKRRAGDARKLDGRGRDKSGGRQHAEFSVRRGEGRAGGGDGPVLGGGSGFGWGSV